LVFYKLCSATTAVMAAEAEFKVPGELEDLELPRKDRYCVPPGGADLRDATSAALHDLLDGALSQLVDGEADALATQAGCFDCLYGFVRDFKYVPSDIKGRLLDVLQHAVTDLAHALGGGLQGTGTAKRSKAAVGAARNAAAAVGDAVQGQAPAGLRNSFKMAVFLLFSAAWCAESVYSSARQNELLQPKVKAVGTAAARKKAAAAAAKEDGKFVWETAREEVLGTMALALTVDLQRLWNLGVSDEAFASLFPRLAYKMLEVPATLRAKAARASALALIAVPYHAVSALAAPVGAAVLQLISDHEHLTSPMAELCAQLAGEHRDTRLAAELLREIGRMNVAEAARNAAGLRNTAAFMTGES
jgi:non-SMC mitotic condensation complex subunit 1, N-term